MYGASDISVGFLLKESLSQLFSHMFVSTDVYKKPYAHAHIFIYIKHTASVICAVYIYYIYIFIHTHAYVYIHTYIIHRSYNT